MYRSQARVESAKAKRYLGQLCKHFRHKVPAEFNADYSWGKVDFVRETGRMGEAELTADEVALIIRIQAESLEKLATVERVIDEHIGQFGWRETLTVTWEREA